MLACHARGSGIKTRQIRQFKWQLDKRDIAGKGVTTTLNLLPATYLNGLWVDVLLGQQRAVAIATFNLSQNRTKPRLISLATVNRKDKVTN